MPAIIFGICGEVGELNGQRLALPRAFERVYPAEPSEKGLWKALLKHTRQALAEDEILVVDAGVKVAALYKAQIKRYVLRLAVNFTARRNFLPAAHEGRPSKYGALVRPLPRKYKEKTLAATAFDANATWLEHSRAIRA